MAVKKISIIMFCLLLRAVLPVGAEKISEIYPGKIVRRDLLAEKRQQHARVELAAPVANRLAFRILLFETRIYDELPIHEKVIVTREKKDVDDLGVQTVVPGEYLDGVMETREEQVALGPVAGEPVRVLGAMETTDDKGIFVDRSESILALFDDPRERGETIEFVTEHHGVLPLALGRAQLNDLFGINYNVRKSSTPRNMKCSGEWQDGPLVPGKSAELTITVVNEGVRGDVYQVLARSISRWPWLDGKMFYVGDLAPGRRRTFSRWFTVPADAAPGDYYLRVGVRDYSGEKPQIPLAVTLNHTAK